MNPTCRLQDASGASVRLIKLAISIKGIGLEDPAISGQMEPRMLTLAIARVIVHRGRRRCSTEWLVVANIDPTSAGVGLAFRQNRNGRVITMQALRGQDMGSKPLAQRRQRRASRTHGIGHDGSLPATQSLSSQLRAGRLRVPVEPLPAAPASQLPAKAAAVLCPACRHRPCAKRKPCWCSRRIAAQPSTPTLPAPNMPPRSHASVLRATPCAGASPANLCPLSWLWTLSARKLQDLEHYPNP